MDRIEKGWIGCLYVWAYCRFQYSLRDCFWKRWWKDALESRAGVPIFLSDCISVGIGVSFCADEWTVRRANRQFVCLFPARNKKEECVAFCDNEKKADSLPSFCLVLDVVVAYRVGPSHLFRMAGCWCSLLEHIVAVVVVEPGKKRPNIKDYRTRLILCENKQ